MALFKEKLELKVEEAELEASRLMSNFPPALKWLLIFILLGLIPSYFLAKKISYYYWEKKFARLEIKAKPSFTNPTDLQVSPAQLISYPDGSYGAVAEIINSNKDLAAPKLEYSWRYFNQNGQEIQPLNSEALGGKTYAFPNRKKYIIEPKITFNEPAAGAELILKQPIKWQKPLIVPQVILQVAPARVDKQLQPYAFTAESSVLNKSSYQIRSITLNFLVYGQDGRLAAVSQRVENDLVPFETRAFKQLWPNLFFIDNARAEIFAETDLLDPANLILPDSENNSSDLSRPKNANPWGF